MKETNAITVGCIGCGTMGGAIIQALLKITDPGNVRVSASQYAHAQNFAEKTGCIACKTNSEVAEKSDYLFLAVKPVYTVPVLDEIREKIKNGAVLVSMAAGLTLGKLRDAAPDHPVIRIMPNMPALAGEAMTALCCGSDVKPDDLDTVTKLLETAGKVEKVDEKLMNCVTAVSGSGPAYAFIFIEALADAAVRFGMPRKQAYVYAAQTLKGSACMALEDSRCPAALKDDVCSPAGTTIEAVAVLEKEGFRNAVIQAATAAFNKSAGMAK